ncbi:MAG: hypothetical protein WBB27_17025, partial [Maribacter sp.]
MKKNLIIHRGLYVIVLLLFFSCSIKKFIPEGERLYTGASLKIELDSLVKVKELKTVETQLNSVIKPVPNTSFLGMRPALYFHYKAQKEKPGFLNKFLNNSFGEEPVYFSSVNTKRIKDLMLNRLDNNGFFFSKANSEVKLEEKFASVSYTTRLPEPYLLENYKLESDSLPIY